MTDVRIHTIPLGFDRCYVLEGKGVIVIDAGSTRKGRAFIRGLERAGVPADAVQLVVLTHAHWDHAGSAGELRELTAAPIALHRHEVDWLERGLTPLPSGLTPWGRLFMSVHRVLLPLVHLPPTSVDTVIGDEGLPLAEHGIPGHVIATPGHSPGSVSVLLDGGEAFVGDLAMNAFPLRLTPGLPILGDDADVIADSWRRLLAAGARTVYPAHGKPFPADVIRQQLGA
jgi:glyoxylase-like metal-dependent hydrolase (beta-lactamase superfamily II)